MLRWLFGQAKEESKKPSGSEDKSVLKNINLYYEEEYKKAKEGKKTSLQNMEKIVLAEIIIERIKDFDNKKVKTEEDSQALSNFLLDAAAYNQIIERTKSPSVLSLSEVRFEQRLEKIKKSQIAVFKIDRFKDNNEESKLPTDVLRFNEKSKLHQCIVELRRIYSLPAKAGKVLGGAGERLGSLPDDVLVQMGRFLTKKDVENLSSTTTRAAKAAGKNFKKPGK